MKRYYANLLGTWVDITDKGTVEDGHDPRVYFEENLVYGQGAKTAECFEYDYVHIQYGGKDYRIHPAMIQIVTEQ